MSLLKKTNKLLKERRIKDFIKITFAYLNFLRIKFCFHITLQPFHPDLKKTNKDWIVYSYLKAKYKKFIKYYSVRKNTKHEYSDIIWWCWFQGEDKAPEISRKCLATLRKNIPNKKIIVITEKNLFEYVSFPDIIIRKYKNGTISKTHFSDLLRLELLIKHGGTWIDATCYCTQSPDYAFNTPLFVFQTKEKNDPGTAAQNWFISAEKNNPILLLTRDLLYEYWNKNSFVIHYFIFYFFFKLATEKYSEEWKNVPWYPDLPPHIMQRELFNKYSEKRFEELKRFSDIHKLSYKLDMPENLSGTLWDKILKDN